jgi:hypothetical protein
MDTTLDMGEVGSAKGRKPKGKSKEEKLAEKIVEQIDNHYFNLSLLANILVNNNPIYTKEKLMSLAVNIIKVANEDFYTEWGGGRTSENLLLANALNDTLNQLGK